MEAIQSESSQNHRHSESITISFFVDSFSYLYWFLHFVRTEEKMNDNNFYFFDIKIILKTLQ